MTNRKLDQNFVSAVQGYLPTALKEKRAREEAIRREEEARIDSINYKIKMIVINVPAIVARATANGQLEACVCVQHYCDWELSKLDFYSKGDFRKNALDSSDLVGLGIIKHLESLGLEVELRFSLGYSQINVKWDQVL